MSVGRKATIAIVLYLTVFRPGFGKDNYIYIFFYILPTLSVMFRMYGPDCDERSAASIILMIGLLGDSVIRFIRIQIHIVRYPYR